MTEFQTTSVRALIRSKNQILVEWFAPKNIFYLPGGTMEAGESQVQALRRELSEELRGTSFKIGEYLGKIGHKWETGSTMNHFYEVNALEPGNIISNESGRSFLWIDTNQPEVENLMPLGLLELIKGL